MLKTHITNINKWIIKNKILFTIIATLFLIIVITTISLKNQSNSPHTALKTNIPPSSLSKDSSVILTNNTSHLSLESYNSYFYKTKSTGLEAAKEFINQNPTLNSQSVIPKNFTQNGPLIKVVKDNEDPFLKKNGINSTNEHYTFGQKINNIPVFSAELKVHLRNGNEIYSLQGNLINNFEVEKEKLSKSTAENIAINQAIKDAGINIPLVVQSSEKYILNKKVLGENDETNYLTLAVVVKNDENSPTLFGKQYFIDLNNGTLIHQIELVHNAQNRTITNRAGGAGRSEGQPAVGGDVDKLYDYMGTTYNFYYNTFQRDGWDGKGGQEWANLISPGGSGPNAGGGQINIPTDYLVLHVVSHEATHIVSDYMNIFGGGGAQTSTLNEAVSDVMANFITGEWHGFSPSGKPFRHADNPQLSKNPEKLFSTNFSCGSEEHVNLTVVSHAVYLMSVGGNENGCTITPIGSANAAKIQYQAMTKYLSSTSNFKDYYTAMTNACNDLFQQGSATCTAVQAALLATELDQQPAGSQTAPKCSGGTEKQPSCPAPIAIGTSATSTTAPVNPTQSTASNNPTFFPLGPNPTRNNLTPTIAPPQTNTPNPINPIIPTGNLVVNNPNIQIPNLPVNGGGNGAGGIRGSIMQFILLLISFLLSLFGIR